MSNLSTSPNLEIIAKINDYVNYEKDRIFKIEILIIKLMSQSFENS